MGFARGNICLLWAASSQNNPPLGGLRGAAAPLGDGCRGDVPQPCVQRGLGCRRSRGSARFWILVLTPCSLRRLLVKFPELNYQLKIKVCIDK